MDKIKSTLLKSLKKAGFVLKEGLDKSKVVTKKSELSLVTETDKQAENIILDILQTEFPEHAILTEESPPKEGSSCRWLIDPIDGTTNFAHSYPVACVSIGFERDGQILLGGVFDPFRDELFLAEKTKGSTLNGRAIFVSKTNTLADALICTGFPYDRRDNPDQYLAVLREILMTSQGIRRTGSAALDFCYIACGRFDGYYEVKLNPWDKAAGMLLVEEAGGKLSDFQGGPLTLDHIQNVATNSLIHDELLAILRPFKNLAQD